MSECIFCKIVAKEIKSYKIYENKDFLAIMDVFPPTFNGKITMPTVLIISKEHYTSKFTGVPEKLFLKSMKLAQRISKAMELALKPMRVCLMIEGTEIDHFHIKLYAVYKETYPGYLSSKQSDGEPVMADKKWLRETAKKIKQALKELRK